MRLFVAVVPPEDAVQHLDDFLSVRRSSGSELRWSDATQWHVTLAFMGSAPERVVDAVVDGVGDVARGVEPFGLSVVGGGCFPDVTRAKVLWAGLDGSGRAVEGDAAGEGGALESLRGLTRGVRSACSVAGAAPAGGPFVPHLTLGRFPRAEDATRWVRVLQTYAGPPWLASQVTVVASHLPRERGHRPRHEVLARLPLGPGAGRESTTR